MTEREFCLWLKGFLDITKNNTINISELEVIKHTLERVLAEKDCHKIADFFPSIENRGFLPHSDTLPDLKRETVCKR